MSRLLKVNGQIVDIDEKTAIGINFQGYDITNPAQRKVNATNSFSVPATARNMSIFGFADNPQSQSLKIYDRSILNYWIGNERVIKDSPVRVNSIIREQRINLFAYEKEDFWDLMKLFKWSDFAREFLDYLKGRGLADTYTDYDDFIDYYTTNTEGIVIPFYLGNLYNYSPFNDNVFLESNSQICLYYKNFPISTRPNNPTIEASGGHTCIYYKTIFEFIEFKYGVNFDTDGNAFIESIFNDPIALKSVIPVRQIHHRLWVPGGFPRFLFEYNETPFFAPLDGVKDKEDKTLYDAVNLFFQRFNIIKDNIKKDNVDYIRLARFDDLELLGGIVDWSGTLQKPYTFKPLVNGYAQENLIKYRSVYEGGASSLGQRVLTCDNKNIDATTDLFEIDEYYPVRLSASGVVIPDLSPQEAFNSFNLLVLDSDTTAPVNILTQNGAFEYNKEVTMKAASLYSLDSEYQLLDKALSYPRVYEVDKWLSISDIRNLEFFKLYYFRELNASFFLNKISGFNPTESLKPTRIELIKVSDRSPTTPDPFEVWVDGEDNIFIDGSGSYFF